MQRHGRFLQHNSTSEKASITSNQEMESTSDLNVQTTKGFDFKEDVLRPLAYFPKDVWGDRFLDANDDNRQIDEYSKQIYPLKGQVTAMLVDSSISQKDMLDLINTVERLGISYHFEKEIEDNLGHIFKAYSYENNYDLYTTSIHFRVFRQHGYRMSCDVFNKFKDSAGKLQKSLRCDFKGILSLYEAAHLKMHNEEFMDEALDLTTDILKHVATGSYELNDRCLHKQIVHATKQAFHTGVQRVETRHFITFYEEDESLNETLLRFAKLDFNMLQLIHRQELSQIIRWCKDFKLEKQLPYVRDRSLECHFWSLSMYFEARYSKARLFMAKVYFILTILDDTYDAFGTREELCLLTQAFERWDKSAMEELPGKMKLVFKHVFNVFNEFEREMKKEEREYAARYSKERVLDLIRSYYVEVKWAHQKYVPSFEEYMCNARFTSVTQIVTTIAMLGMEPEIADEKAFEWVVNPVPQVIRGAEVVSRLMDDIVTHQEEQKRGIYVATSVECYMKEHGLNRDDAVAALRKIIGESWKDMNEGLVKPNCVSPRIIIRVFNFIRMVDALYKEMDGYTNPEKVMKDDVLAVYAESLVV